MAYYLNAVTIRTDNTPRGLKKIEEVWRDIASGKLPVLFDSEHCFRPGISPVSMYHNYAAEEAGDYDLSILGVTADFFGRMEALVSEGRYRRYEADDGHGDIANCTKQAWAQVWAAQKNGEIRRSFTVDYESAVPPEYTKDGNARCYLYIAVRD